MSFQPSFPGLFSPAQGAAPVPQAELPLAVPQAATQKQIAFARQIAARTGAKLPNSTLASRATLSAWIDAHKPSAPTGKFANYPSSKQVAFAERIARLKHSDVPRACFRDKTLMSRWIDANKPRPYTRQLTRSQMT